MRNPFITAAIAAAISMAMASQMQRGTFYEGNSGRSRSRTKGRPGKPGDKLARMAAECRIGVRHP